jgi:hypothetical protein
MIEDVDGIRSEEAIARIAAHLGADFEELALHLRALEPCIVPRAFQENEIGLETTRHQNDMSPLEMVLLNVGPPVAITFALPGCRVWRYEFRWTGPDGGYGVLTGKSIDLDARASAAEVLEAIAKQRTKQLRKASFCGYCGELVMPDSRDEKYCCMGCSERFLGVVH